MIAVERWEIHYGDGSRFTSDDGTWAEAPPFGVQAIVYYNVDGTKLIHAEQHDDSVYEIREGVEAGGQPVKFGMWTDNESYWMMFDATRGMVKP
jgi:hypothetical protein